MKTNRFPNRLDIFCIMSTILIFVIVGCASTGTPTDTSWKLDAYNALAESKVAYDRAFTALALADKAGKLKPEVKLKAIQYGKMYQTAHNAAVEQLIKNQKPDTFAMKTALQVLTDLALPFVMEFMSGPPVK